MDLIRIFKKLVGAKKGADAGVSKIIIVVIGIVIAISLIPTIVISVNSVLPNLSGAALLLMGLVTFIFVAGIIILMVKKLF